MAIRLTVDNAARVVIILALTFLHNVAALARSGDLALTFVLPVTLLLLELLCDRANLDEARRVVNLVWSEKRFIHGNVWWKFYHFRNPILEEKVHTREACIVERAYSA
jgi:hypothetical protein